MKRPIKVLIVDDSALVRGLLTRILGADRGIEVVGTAADAYVARTKIKRLEPDVLTLDVEMPRMDGLQFLRNLMRLRPMPVVMCSSMTERGAEVTLAALALGAVDFVAKPKLDLAHVLEVYADELVGKVKGAATARLQPRGELSLPGAAAAAAPTLRFRTSERIIAIGASTGGTEAIRQVLSRLPASAPGVLIGQHLPRSFSAQFAASLDASSPLHVREAEHGLMIQAGHAYVAPGDRHLTVMRDGAHYRCQLSDGPPVNRHRPSIDLLFESMAASVGVNGVGVILTGMGADGAKGLKQMRAQGARTIAQDERSSVVWGMPGTAVALGAVEQIVAVEEIAAALARGRDAVPTPAVARG
jgi:two-component system, chemotaxis family, protein-glutamate methylesterase/glutaminase